MKPLRTCSISMAIALALLITTQGGAFAFIQQPLSGELAARVDTVLTSEAPDMATHGQGQGDALSSVEELALDEIAAGADSILVGTVSDMTAYEKDGRRGDIYTRVTLAVEETIKGTPAPQATIIVPGGEVNGLGLQVSGTAEFTIGEKIVVFLKDYGKGLEVCGPYQGKFTVEQGRIAERNESLSKFEAEIYQAMGIESVKPNPSFAMFDEVLQAPIVAQVTQQSAVTQDFVQGWQDIMTDNFEGAFPGSWDIGISPGYTDAYWGRTNYRSVSPTRSVFCARVGTANVTPGSSYPNNMAAWMIYGPFNLLGASDAELDFSLWYDTAAYPDRLSVYASTNGTNYYGVYVTGSSSGNWESWVFDLTNVYTLGNLCGQPQVWVAFRFLSDGASSAQGVFIDDVVLRSYFAGGTSPQITSISPDSGPAGTGFSVNITGSNFGATQGTSGVSFWRIGSTYVPANVTSWSDTQVTCYVPAGASSGSTTQGVRITTGAGASNEFAFTVPFSYGLHKWPGANPMGEKFLINENCADCVYERREIISAMQAWNNTDNTDFYFEYGGSTTATDYSPNDYNEIMWVNVSRPYIAACYGWYDTDTGAVLEKDIVFNDYDYTWDTSGSPSGSQMDVQNIATHELGHCFVLLDLYGTADQEKTMYGYGSLGETKKCSPEPQDVAGIHWIYPGPGTRGQYHLKITNNDDDDLTVYFKSDNDTDYTRSYLVATGQTMTAMTYLVLPADSHQVSIKWTDPDKATPDYSYSAWLDVPVEGDTEFAFTIPPYPVPPTVTTQAATGVSLFSARLNGNLTDLGTASSANVSFQWGTSSGNLTSETPVQTVTANVTFYYDLGSLSANTTYYFCAKAVGHGTSNGTEKSFTTLPTLPQIPFVSDRDTNLEIYAMNGDGTGQTRLTNNPAVDTFPAASPDGSKIAFVSNRSGNREIYTMNADSTNLTQLTNNPAVDNFPAWSPDGTRIAFGTNRDGNPEIYTMNASDGSGLMRLTNNPAYDDFPAWSPDGSKIAFSSSRDGDFEIYTMNASDGSGVTRLTNNPAVDNFPAWSPDGNKIAFSSNRDGDGEIYRMNADSTNVTQLTNNSVQDWQPFWSPNKITFSTNRDGNPEIYTMNASDGSGLMRLTNNPANDWLRGRWVSPSVVTNDASNITSSSAVLSGNLTDLGSLGVVDVSFQWGLTADNYTGTTLAVSVNATGPFSAAVTSLSGNTTYHFRAKAAGDGLNFGDDVTFTTLPPVPPTVTTDNATGVSLFSARLNGNLTSLGTATSANVSFLWGTSSGNLTSETPVQTVTANVTFYYDLGSLSANTTYYFCAKAVGHGTSNGTEKSFTTLPPVPPTVTTDNATGVSLFSARLNGNLTDLGTASSANVSFLWGTSSGNLTSETPVQTVTANVTFYYDLGSLSANTTYYFRAKAVGHGTSNGTEKSFTTLPTTPPAVTTDNATSVTFNSARLNGNLTAMGTATSANVSFQWGTASGNLTSETPVQTVTANVTFYYDLGSLSANTTYYFRAKAVGHGTSNGTEKSFITPTAPAPPAGGGGGGGGPATSTVSLTGLRATTDLTVDWNGVAQATTQLHTSDNKTSLWIAKGTIMHDASGQQLLSITANATASPPEPPPQGAVVWAYNFGLDGATFEPAITLTISYDPNALPQGVTEDTLYIAYWDGSKWVTVTSAVKTDTHIVSANISHFTQFAVLGKITPIPTPSLSVPRPAAYSISSLACTPGTCEEGEAVIISATVANTGELSGQYIVILSINGAKEQSKEISLPGGATQKVTFEVRKSIAATYQADVNGLTTTFVVEKIPPLVISQPTQQPATTPPTTAVNWWAIIALIAVAVIGGAIYVVLRMRRRAL